MMHRFTPDTLDGDELLALADWRFEHAAGSPVAVLYATFTIPADKDLAGLRRLHLTNGVNHRYLEPGLDRGVTELPSPDFPELITQPLPILLAAPAVDEAEVDSDGTE